MALKRDDRLNIVKYYGSKAMMFQDIVDRLDYDNAKVYLEVFGGGASVLLNKPKHDIEIYNEINHGLYILFSVLSNYETGIELRERLKEVSYSKENFKKALEYKNAFEEAADKENERKFEQFIAEIEEKYKLELYAEYKSYYLKYCRTYCKKYNTPECTKGCKDDKRIDKVIDKTLRKTTMTAEEKKMAKALLKEKQKIEDGTFSGKDRPQYKAIQVAMATFIVQNMSRDGMGKYFSNLSSNESVFYNKVSNLIDVIERLDGVIVLNEDAKNLFDREYLNSVLLEKGLDICHIPDWQLMYYVDAPYLEDQDVTLAKQERGIRKGNPGGVYKGEEFDYMDHAFLLNEIRYCKANMLVSNYRDINLTYDRFLTAKEGWTYTEYPAKTTVGGINVERTEILWQNY